MRKVGIITLNGYFNYGNRLQNYALERVLRSFDCDTSTIKVQNIDASTSKDTVLYRLQRIVRKDKGEILDKLQRKTRNIIHKTEIKESTRIRTEIFKDFTKKHIRETDLTISNGDINKDIIEQYDFFVAGSDQVWNPYYVQGSSTYFLDFAPKEKRISYAASFGVATLPEEYKENYREFIINILHLSVREEAAAKIIKDLTGKDALVHVDPT
ncbi:MAG: polysaccharide pyruvyl transferase family protein, partial [Bacteroidales bacterium]|nr:polysaccharide pyruvyl transferase family protein [Bacteroidales bacterium]